MAQPSGVQKLKWFLLEHFEQMLVVLVVSLLVIHWLVDHKLAFLSFYYLAIIVAGFLVGRDHRHCVPLPGGGLFLALNVT
ncbi:MAG: hypothetical protein HY560_13000 [Gemmatimonadetes bacterium]|nr:hypothetical protein [Gemmatimonadota bacterium]